MEQIGDSLRQARIAKGQSLAQVEEETKIRGKYLAALERGEYQLLPGRVYTAGFLRIYARYLGLDAEMMVKRFKAELQPIVQQEQREEPKPVTVKRKRIRPVRMAVVLLLFVVLFTAGVYMVFRLFKADAGGPSVVTPAVAPGETNANPQPETSSNSQPAAVNSPQPGINAEVSGTPAVVAPKVQAGTVELELLVEVEKCWIQVIKDGVKVFEGTLRPGERQIFTAVKELVVRLGNSGAVRVKFNGQDLGRPGNIGDVVTLMFDQAGYTVVNTSGSAVWN